MKEIVVYPPDRAIDGDMIIDVQNIPGTEGRWNQLLIMLDPHRALGENGDIRRRQAVPKFIVTVLRPDDTHVNRKASRSAK